MRGARSRSGRLILLLTWLGAAACVFPFRSRGWIPTDEGTFALSAERVLEGGLPHRDFVESYTGGSSEWNALAFRLLGLNLMSLRLAVFLAFLAFVPAVFAIASRFGPPPAAALITLLAVAWSLPNYFAASVSWFNLFLATWGTLALLRYIEGGRKRWLFLAGVFAGVSCLFKVIGAEFLAAAVLLLVYREQEASAASSVRARPRLSAFLVFQAAGLALFLAVLFRTVRSQLDAMVFVNFLAPAAAVSGFLLWRGYADSGGAFGRRLWALAKGIAPLAAGFVVPILLFTIPYALRGAVPDLVRGLVTGTEEHVGLIRSLLPPVSALWPAVPYTAILCAGALAPSRLGRPLMLLLAILLPAMLWLSSSSEQIYRDVWYSARFLGVSVVFAACLALRRAHRSGAWSSETRQKVFLLAAVVALTGLVQFPYPQAIYFLYFAPLVALAIFALVRSEPRPPRWLHEGLLVFYLLFAIVRMSPAYVDSLGHSYRRYDPTGILDLPRGGGLRISAKNAGVYNTLIPLIQEKSRGKPIYAGPDSALVYFLSGLPEALVPTNRSGSPRDPMQRPEELFRSLEQSGTLAIVLNREPLFAPPLTEATLRRFEALFPRARVIGTFTVRWKD